MHRVEVLPHLDEDVFRFRFAILSVEIDDGMRGCSRASEVVEDDVHPSVRDRTLDAVLRR